MRVHDSALKHGVLPDDAIHAATWALWIEDLDDDSPARQLRLGFDTKELGESDITDRCGAQPENSRLRLIGRNQQEPRDARGAQSRRLSA
ncbi:hypothetical protein [Microcella pacifica]|uniref:hypothetical protein n=1 Tax=Microcella pacifica TaxID=2591847 RepID=UPI002E2DD961|nr:hypothetical protein [Microcella pacifica]